MDIKTILKNIALSSCLVGMVVSTGCSMRTSLVNTENIVIERVNSASVNILQVSLLATESTMMIKGKLKQRFPSHGAIPGGHLHIELLAHDGVIFKEATIGYKRASIKSRKANFSVPVPFERSSISSIRVIHHDARSHHKESTRSPWRDIIQNKQAM
ncbi:MAG TPA: hypothetical protein VIQ03_15035 [Gammaproteobacteria bacterium]